MGNFQKNPEKDLGFTQKWDHNTWCLMSMSIAKDREVYNILHLKIYLNYTFWNILLDIKIHYNSITHICREKRNDWKTTVFGLTSLAQMVRAITTPGNMQQIILFYPSIRVETLQGLSFQMTVTKFLLSLKKISA